MGEISDLKERIEDYQVYGYSSILTSNQEVEYKFFSVFTFLCGVFLVYMFYYAREAFFATLMLVGAIIIGISFLLDIILIIDKYRDKKYRGF